MSDAQRPSLELLSWNVLADAYVRATYFPKTDPALLARGARTGAIVDRIAASTADVIGLQEVEHALVAALEALGTFDVRFLQKGRGKPDGCALLARRASTRIERTREVRYDDGSGHVALLAVVRAGDLEIGIGTTHVKWDAPETPAHERFAIREFDGLVRATRSDDVPWVVCGDFNVTPEDPALRELDPFVDVYAGSPRAKPTVNANGWIRRIDYVFADARLTAEPLDVEDVDASTPMPSSIHPSDHLPIGARIRARSTP